MPQGSDWLSTEEAAARMHVPPDAVVPTLTQEYGADPEMHVVMTTAGPMVSRCSVAFVVADRQLSEATRDAEPTGSTLAKGPSLGYPHSMQAKNSNRPSQS
ncbi:hypothetical protein [Fodinicola acaciae]|uniref:hypothetical protein n=1 Tax=Fodinicola acaciae TaxID=2681555 RepID=UPI0013CFE2C9|nr:hypothetical protein [Fodinicola acaciae]